jgi:hypothetical protein
MVSNSTWCQFSFSFHAKLVLFNLLMPLAYVDGISMKSFDMRPMVVGGEKKEGGVCGA